MHSKLAFVLATILLAACARASVEEDLSTIYDTKPAQLILTHRGEMARRIEPLLLRQCNYMSGLLKTWEVDPAARYLFNGTSREIDIRSPGHLAFGLATINRAIPADAGGPISRDEARDRAIAILRFVLPTHGAGEARCTDGKQWHDQWQSALWGHSIGKAAWLLWDDLDPKLRWLAARMICDEADRFVGRTPPTQVKNDTKAEENAWDSQIISLAYNMFPRHPHHEQWRETAIRWILSGYPTAADVASTQVIDGKPMNQWLTGANIHDDYTLENHNRVHPDYMSTVRINLAQKLDYDWAGNPEPQALRFNGVKLYASLKSLTCPDGNWIYPNGQDWWLHRSADWLDIDGVMAAMFDDPQASRLTRVCIETVEKMTARHANGAIFEDDEVTVPTAHAIPTELHADPYLLLRSLGEGAPPVSEEQLFSDLAGVRVFEAGKFAILRTPKTIASFSWGPEVMGLCLPLRKDLLLTPNTRSMIGDIQLASGKRDVPKATKAQVMQKSGALAVAAIVERAGGAIEQRCAFVALGDGRVVYVDSLKSSPTTTKPAPARIELGTLGILNDKHWVYHDGQRTLTFDAGQRVFAAADSDHGEDVALSSPWYNIDDLGIVCLKTSGRQVYHAKPSQTRGRLEQMFVLNAVAANAADGAQTVLVFMPNIDAAGTRAAAGKCKLTQSDAKHFAITLDDGKTILIDLDQLTVELK